MLEAKRDEINLLLPTVAPSVGTASVERDGDNYIMRIGEKIVVRQPGRVPRKLLFEYFSGRSLFSSLAQLNHQGGRVADVGCGHGASVILNSLNDAIVKALPADAGAELRRKLDAG